MKFEYRKCLFETASDQISLMTMVVMLALIGCAPQTGPINELPSEKPVESFAQSGETTTQLASESGDFDPQRNDEPANLISKSNGDQEESELSQPTIEIPGAWKRLGNNEIWIDFVNKRVIVGGTICLTRGQLEMFVCPERTKEHESIIAAKALASEVHGALLALGVDPGKPTQWDPEYEPVSGPSVDIDITWMDADKKKQVTRPAEEMIRNVETGKPLEHEFVFGGSEIFVDPTTGDEFYYGDSGEMICLSNFSTATIDLNVESSQSNESLLFEALTENIPPVGTPVYVVMKPGKWVGKKPEKNDPDEPPVEPDSSNQDNSNQSEDSESSNP